MFSEIRRPLEGELWPNLSQANPSLGRKKVLIKLSRLTRALGIRFGTRGSMKRDGEQQMDSQPCSHCGHMNTRSRHKLFCENCGVSLTKQESANDNPESGTTGKRETSRTTPVRKSGKRILLFVVLSAPAWVVSQLLIKIARILLADLWLSGKAGLEFNCADPQPSFEVIREIMKNFTDDPVLYLYAFLCHFQTPIIWVLTLLLGGYWTFSLSNRWKKFR